MGSSKPFDGPSLLDGEYNEYDAHAEFQSALAEWRNNKGAQKQTEKKVTFQNGSVAKTPSEYQSNVLFVIYKFKNYLGIL